MHCIHVRTTPEGPALGLTNGDKSDLCSEARVVDRWGHPVAIVTAGPEGVQIQVMTGYGAIVGG